MRVAATPTSRAGRALVAASVLAVFVSCLSWHAWDLRSYERFQRDEANWVAVSKFSFGAFFVQHDYSNPTWDESLNTFGRENPHVAKFLIGGGLWLHGDRDFHGVQRWDPSLTMQERIEQGGVPAAEELRAARLPVAVTTAVTAALLVLLFGFLQPGLAGVAGGLVAATVFAIHPLCTLHGRTVLLDMPAVCLATASVLFILCADRSLQERRTARGLLYGFLGATFSGLAVSAKLSGALTVLAVALAALWTWWRCRTRAAGVVVVLCVVVPPAIFFGHNPYLWHRGMEGVRTMLNLADIVAARRDHLVEDALNTWPERLQAFSSRAFRNPVAGVLAGIGAALLLVRPTRCVPLTLWLLLVPGGVLAWTPLSYGRYYLPLVPLVALAVAHATVESARAATRSWIRRRRAPATPP